jgi:hypothetical protein
MFDPPSIIAQVRNDVIVAPPGWRVFRDHRWSYRGCIIFIIILLSTPAGFLLPSIGQIPPLDDIGLFLLGIVILLFILIVDIVLVFALFSRYYQQGYILTPEGFVVADLANGKLLKAIDYALLDDMKLHIIRGDEGPDAYYVDLISQGRQESLRIPNHFREREEVAELILKDYAHVKASQEGIDMEVFVKNRRFYQE